MQLVDSHTTILMLDNYLKCTMMHCALKHSVEEMNVLLQYFVNCKQVYVLLECFVPIRNNKQAYVLLECFVLLEYFVNSKMVYVLFEYFVNSKQMYVLLKYFVNCKQVYVLLEYFVNSKQLYVLLQL